MFFQADVWLIEKVFERFSHWWQKTISYSQDCFFWAQAICVCTPFVVFIIATLIWDFTQFDNIIHIRSMSARFIMWVVLSVLISAIFYLITPHIKKEVYSFLLQGVANQYKLCWQFFRITIFFLNVSLTAFHSYKVSLLLAPLTCIFLILTVFYFLSCDPLPPSSEKSRLQKWVASIREKTTPALSPAPTPAS